MNYPPDPASPPPVLTPGWSARAQKILHLSLLGFAFSTPLSISLSQIFLGVGFLGWVFYFISTPANQRKKIIVSPVGWAYILFFAAASLSVISSSEKWAALDSLRSLWVFFAFFLGANWIQSSRQFKQCLILLVSSASINALIGIIQYAGGLHWGGQVLIPALPHAVGLYGVSSMTFSGLTLAILIAGLVPLLPRGIRIRDVIPLIPLSLLFLGVVFSCQRGAWLGLGAGIVFMAAVTGRKTLFFTLLGMGLGIALIYHTQPYIKYRAFLIFELSAEQPINSPSERLLLWQTAIKIVEKHPLTGTGLDQFQKSAGEIILPHLKPENTNVTLCHAHSNPLQILATTGFIGFLAFIWLWIVIYSEGFRMLLARSRTTYPYILGVLSAVTAFHVEGLFEYTFGDSEIATLIWFLVGAMVAVGRLGSSAGPTDQQNSGPAVQQPATISRLPHQPVPGSTSFGKFDFSIAEP